MNDTLWYDWARFVVMLRKRGITTVWQEENQWGENNKVPMNMFAVNENDKCIGFYNAAMGKGKFIHPYANRWSREGRTFTEVEI